MARTGLRMMPTFPSPSLRYRKAGFPVTAPKLAYQRGPSLIALRLSLLPACPSRDQVCLHPSCSSRAAWALRSESEVICRWKHRHASDLHRSTPGALAPVEVLLSRAINAYSTPSAPLAGTAQLHRTATYMCCLRCAGAP